MTKLQTNGADKAERLTWHWYQEGEQKDDDSCRWRKRCDWAIIGAALARPWTQCKDNRAVAEQSVRKSQES